MNNQNNKSDNLTTVEPPIVDFLFLDPSRDVYAVTFVPRDSISSRQKEIVEIPRLSEDGDRISLVLQEISKIAGQDVDRIFHRGGDGFGLYLKDGELLPISRASSESKATGEVLEHLHDIAVIAEHVFCATQSATAKSA